jgi:hypothetical protein
MNREYDQALHLVQKSMMMISAGQRATQSSGNVSFPNWGTTTHPALYQCGCGGRQRRRDGKLESLADRVHEIERILIAKGHLRATTKQGQAISFLVENLEALQAIVAEHKRLSS